MIAVTHTTDYEKTSIFYNDGEFIAFTKMIRQENGDIGIAVDTVLQCAAYIYTFCDNLKLANKRYCPYQKNLV